MLPLAFYPNFYDPLAPEPWYNLLLFCARRSAQQLVLTRHLSPKFKVLGLISILSTPFQTRIYWFHSFINVVTSAQSARQRKYFVNRHFDIFTLTNLLYLKKGRACVNMMLVRCDKMWITGCGRRTDNITCFLLIVLQAKNLRPNMSDDVFRCRYLPLSLP